MVDQAREQGYHVDMMAGVTKSTFAGFDQERSQSTVMLPVPDFDGECIEVQTVCLAPNREPVSVSPVGPFTTQHRFEQKPQWMEGRPRHHHHHLACCSWTGHQAIMVTAPRQLTIDIMVTAWWQLIIEIMVTAWWQLMIQIMVTAWWQFTIQIMVTAWWQLAIEIMVRQLTTETMEDSLHPDPVPWSESRTCSET